MAANKNNNTNSDNKADNKADKKKQDIPIYSAFKAIVARFVGLSISAVGVLMLLSSILFIYDYWHGEKNFNRSLNTYKETLENLHYMVGWFDIRDIFTHWVQSGQEWIHDMTQKLANLTGYNGSFLGQKSDAFGYKQKILNTINNGVNSYNPNGGEFWKKIVEFFPYYLMDSLLTFLTFVLKLLMIVNFLPIYILLIIPAINNGYYERKVATFKGELDKQDRVEFAFRKLRIVFITVMYFFLAIPHSLNPLYFLIPSSVLTAIAMRYLARYFKKYY